MPGQCANVEWERGWQSAEALAAAIRAADICLGIFGAGDKAQRVWPLKNYSYIAVGRDLISDDTPEARVKYAAASAVSAMLFISHITSRSALKMFLSTPR